MGNHPSKFQPAGVPRFGGVREHPNTQTHSLTDWCFDRVKERVLSVGVEYFQKESQMCLINPFIVCVLTFYKVCKFLR